MEVGSIQVTWETAINETHELLNDLEFQILVLLAEQPSTQRELISLLQEKNVWYTRITLDRLLRAGAIMESPSGHYQLVLYDEH